MLENSLYGSLGGRHTLAKHAEYVSEAFYDHPAYMNLVGAQQKLNLIQTLMDEVIKVIPETPTKSAAVMHLHTASMWLDKAMDQGHTALRKAFSQMEEQKKRLAEQEAHNARAGDEGCYSKDPTVAGPEEALNQGQPIAQASSRKANRA